MFLYCLRNQFKFIKRVLISVSLEYPDDEIGSFAFISEKCSE